MPIHVCFNGVNTLQSLLMHPKDKVATEQKKDVVYHWKCQADGCNSSYVGETSGGPQGKSQGTLLSVTHR